MVNLTNNSKKYIEASQQGAPYYTLTAKEARATRANLQAEHYLAPELASIVDTTFDARDGYAVNIRIYTPIGKGPFPIIIYYHGGGWVFGNLDSADAGCRFIAAEANAIVVSVDYRLAPEYKFPIPLHDAYDALLWVFKHANQFNGISSHISVAGDSAGGNLATVVTHLAKQLDGPEIIAQLLIYPVTDVSTQTYSYKAFGKQHGLDAQAMLWFAELYTKNADELKNPLVSPLLAENVTQLPKALIIAAEADILVDEGLAYAKKLKEANVHTEYIVLNGHIHSFFSKINFFEEETKETAKLIAQFLQTKVIIQ